MMTHRKQGALRWSLSAVVKTVSNFFFLVTVLFLEPHKSIYINIDNLHAINIKILFYILHVITEFEML